MIFKKKQISEPPSFKCQTFVTSSLNQCLMPVEGDATLMDEMSSCGAFTSTGVCVWGVPQTTHRCGCPGVPESTWRECLRNVPTPSRAGHYKEGAPAAQISPYYTQTQRPTLLRWLPGYHHHFTPKNHNIIMTHCIASHRSAIMLTLRDQFIFQSVGQNLLYRFNEESELIWKNELTLYFFGVK